MYYKTMKEILKHHKAIAFAAKAHEGQTRKDGVTPYIVHPIGVAEIVKYYNGNDDEINAAHLHDVVEDCDITNEEILEEFGFNVARIVQGLTNVFTTQNYPTLNRAQRKAAEDQRLKVETHSVKFVKACDILYNIHDIETMPDGFGKRLLSEKKNTVQEMFGEIDYSWPPKIFQIRRRLFDFFEME